MYPHNQIQIPKYRRIKTEKSLRIGSSQLVIDTMSIIVKVCILDLPPILLGSVFPLVHEFAAFPEYGRTHPVHSYVLGTFSLRA